MLRKSVIDELGGLKTFGCYLAEDFFIAKAIRDKGWKMRISNQPAIQNSGICDISKFQERLIRWAKLRVAMVPTTILLEPLSECMVLGALASWSAALLFNWDPLVFYLVHVLTWFLSDWILLSIVQVNLNSGLICFIINIYFSLHKFQNGSLSFHKFEFVVGWLFREISGPYLFLHALWNPAIRWRRRTYKLQWGGIAYELPSGNVNMSTKRLLVS